MKQELDYKPAVSIVKATSQTVCESPTFDGDLPICLSLPKRKQPLAEAKVEAADGVPSSPCVISDDDVLADAAPTLEETDSTSIRTTCSAPGLDHHTESDSKTALALNAQATHPKGVTGEACDEFVDLVGDNPAPTAPNLSLRSSDSRDQPPTYSAAQDNVPGTSSAPRSHDFCPALSPEDAAEEWERHFAEQVCPARL